MVELLRRLEHLRGRGCTYEQGQGDALHRRLCKNVQQDLSSKHQHMHDWRHTGCCMSIEVVQALQTTIG